MEIKVISATEDFGTKSCYLTTILEGTNINHRFIWYGSQQEFEDTITNLTKGISGKDLGIPEKLWDKSNPNQEGYFVCMYYHDNDDVENYIMIKHAEVYITKAGQTIDKILVD